MCECSFCFFVVIAALVVIPRICLPTGCQRCLAASYAFSKVIRCYSGAREYWVGGQALACSPYWFFVVIAALGFRG